MVKKLPPDWLPKKELLDRLVNWRIKDLLPADRKRSKFRIEINKYVDRFYTSEDGLKAGNCQEIAGVRYFRTPAVALWLKGHKQKKWNLIPDDLMGSDAVVKLGGVQAEGLLMDTPKAAKKSKTLSQESDQLKAPTLENVMSNWRKRQ